MDEGNEEVTGAFCEVFPDRDAGKTIVRFHHPETGEPLIELALSPETSRDLAFELTRSSYEIEDRP